MSKKDPLYGIKKCLDIDSLLFYVPSNSISYLGRKIYYFKKIKVKSYGFFEKSIFFFSLIKMVLFAYENWAMICF